MNGHPGRHTGRGRAAPRAPGDSRPSPPGGRHTRAPGATSPGFAGRFCPSRSEPPALARWRQVPAALLAPRRGFGTRGLRVGLRAFLPGLHDLLLVALWRERRWIVLRQHDDIDAACRGRTVAADVGPRDGPIGARREVEMLAVAGEDRIARVAQAVGQLPALALRDRVQKDRALCGSGAAWNTQSTCCRATRQGRAAGGGNRYRSLSTFTGLRSVDVHVPGR